MTTLHAELPPPPTALPIVIAIPSTRARRRRISERFSDVLLQGSHRLGTVALLGLLGAVAMAVMPKAFYGPLSLSVGCADVGLCCTLLAMSFCQRGDAQWREARGAAIFNGAIAIVGLLIMLAARLSVMEQSLHDAGTSVRAQFKVFFSPPAVVPQQ